MPHTGFRPPLSIVMKHNIYSVIEIVLPTFNVGTSVFSTQMLPGRHSPLPLNEYVTWPKLFRFSLATSPTMVILYSCPSITS